MAKKNQKRKTVRLVSNGAAYYTRRRNDGEKLMLRKFNWITRKVEEFKEAAGKNLGRNEVKKRK